MISVNDVVEQSNKINIDGREMIVKFTMSSFAMLQAKYGSVDEAMKVISSEDTD